ncbi:MAG TPA: class I SAM-dependent methyltransferase [Streptosporangiaceae bacterium]
MKTADQVSSNKLRGGFYTPAGLVRVCLDRLDALTSGREGLSVLEPSAGDGGFIRGLAGHSVSSRVTAVTAIERVATEAAKCRAGASSVAFDLDVVTGSALDREHWERPRYDAAIGNPPFVRFQFVPPDDVDAADDLARHLGLSFAGVSNLWLPVFLAAMTALKDGGVFAFVVPAEFFTGVSARVARHWLTGHADDLKVDMFPAGSFPGVLQEVVVISGRAQRACGPAGTGLAGTGPAGTTRTGSVQLLIEQHGPGGTSRRWQHPVTPDASTWTGYLLTPAHLDALAELRHLEDVRRLGQLAKFEVATVTGANEFFTVDQQRLDRHQLTAWGLPLLPRVRHAPGLRFTTADHDSLTDGGARAYLLSFAADRPEPEGAALAYLRQGEQDGLASRYKCRIRTPWYRVPVVAPGELMLSKRSHHYPRVIVNCAGAHTTDTVYRGRLLPAADRTAADLAAAFHNSLTLLTAEMEGRSFGGGVLELVPSEVGRLLVPVPVGFGAELNRLDVIARTGSQRPAHAEPLIEETDRLLAKQVRGLGGPVIELVQEARHLLLARRMDRSASS